MIKNSQFLKIKVLKLQIFDELYPKDTSEYLCIHLQFYNTFDSLIGLSTAQMKEYSRTKVSV